MIVSSASFLTSAVSKLVWRVHQRVIRRGMIYRRFIRNGFFFQIIYIIIKFPIRFIVKDSRFLGVHGIVRGSFCFEIKYEFIVKSPSNWLRIVLGKDVIIGKNISDGGGDVVPDIVIKVPSIGSIIVWGKLWLMFWVKQCQKIGHWWRGISSGM